MVLFHVQILGPASVLSLSASSSIRLSVDTKMSRLGEIGMLVSQKKKICTRGNRTPGRRRCNRLQLAGTEPAGTGHIFVAMKAE